jgi:hypothetical protein
MSSTSHTKAAEAHDAAARAHRMAAEKYARGKQSEIRAESDLAFGTAEAAYRKSVQAHGETIADSRGK